jgi:very-short-patch-repair endonuclease
VRAQTVTGTTHRARQLRQSPPDAERALWQALRDRQIGGHKFRRQHPVGRYIADFACIEAMLIVELDGGQHFSPEGMTADARRTAELNQLGYHVLRFTDREVLLEREAVRLSIFNWLEANGPRPNRDPHPNPLPQAVEGVRSGHQSSSPLPLVEGARQVRADPRPSFPLPLGEGQGEGQPGAAAPNPRLNSDPHPSPLPQAGEGVKSDPNPLPRAGEGAITSKEHP